jgi:hypothetical protein
VTKLFHLILSRAVNSSLDWPLRYLAEFKSAGENIFNKLATEIWQIHASNIFSREIEKSISCRRSSQNRQSERVTEGTAGSRN